jgi:F-type H+-transporting ATPase subunit a
VPPYPDIPKQFALTGEPLWTFGHAGNDFDFLGISVKFDISITNAHFTMLLVTAILLLVFLLATRVLSDRPSGLQNAVEFLVQGLADFVEGLGGKPALQYVALFGTLFVFLIFCNWLSVVPLVGQVPWLHSPTADYHTNFGLALVAFYLYQVEGFRKHGAGYVSRWFNFAGFREPGGIITKVGMGVIFLLVGVIEFFSELFRMLTLTLRLWGNVLGGEIMLVVISALLLLPGLAMPFVLLEVLIGFVQGLIFALLVLIYFILAVESHEEHSEGEQHPAVQHAPAHAPA